MADILLLIMFIIGIYLFWQILYDTGRFVTCTYVLPAEKIKKSCKIVLLADLHGNSFGKDNSLLEQAIDSQKPDVIMVAGDMITAGKKKDMTHVAEFINRIKAKYPVYYADGNHEYRMALYPEQFGNAIREYQHAVSGDGLKWLQNTSDILEAYNIRVHGAMIDKKFYKRMENIQMEEDYMEALLGRPEEGVYHILLAHNPEYFPLYAAWGADLTLSGHVHGGMVRVPFWRRGVVSPKVSFFPKYDGGLFDESGKKMILSRGLGVHTIPVRLFNPCEMVVIELKSKEERQA